MVFTQKISLEKNVLLIIIFFLCSCSPSKFYNIQYKDVIFNGTEYVTVEEEMLDFREKLNILATLSYYGIYSKIDGGVLYLKEDFYEKDIDLMYNIALKSRDTSWFNQHIKGIK
jgi:hypothetical protein